MPTAIAVPPSVLDPLAPLRELAPRFAEHALAIRRLVLEDRSDVVDVHDEAYLHLDELLAWLNWRPHYQLLTEERPYWRAVEAVNEAAALMCEMLVLVDTKQQVRKYRHAALDLAAEVQSMLMVLTQQRRSGHFPDQYRWFEWLDRQAKQTRYFIRRYFRLDDRADPAEWRALARRVAVMYREVLNYAERPQLVKRAEELAEELETPKSAVWQELDELAERLLRPPLTRTYQRRLKAAFKPYRELITQHRRRNRQLAALLELLDSRPAMDDAEEAAVVPLPEEWADEADWQLVESDDSEDEAYVVEARNLIQGRVVVLVGGSKRPESEHALRERFAMQELIWVPTQGRAKFAIDHLLQRDDIAAVLLAIRWVSHRVSDEVVTLCRDYNRPLVRLPGGYSVGQVAYRLVSQISGRISDDV